MKIFLYFFPHRHKLLNLYVTYSESSLKLDLRNIVGQENVSPVIELYDCRMITSNEGLIDLRL